MARKSRKNLIDTEQMNIMPNIRTALYVRLSVEDGNGRSNSVENQQLILNDFIAERPEFAVIDTYIDNGLSGMNFNRPEFQRMTADIEAGKIDCVIAKDLSRLGRNSIDTGYYIENYFYQHKIRFIAVTDRYDTAEPNSASGGIMLPLKNLVNEAYALDIAKKERSAKRQLMLNGELTNGAAPFGYILDPNDHHRLIIDEKAAPTVKKIFEWYVDGASARMIANRLNEMEIIPPSQHKKTQSVSDKGLIKIEHWNSRTINGILKNRNYTGDLAQGKFRKIDSKFVQANESEIIIVRDTHEPIISRDVYEKACQIMTERSENYKKQNFVSYSDNIFDGCKMVCGHCGKPLYRVRNKNRYEKFYYYISCISIYTISKSACVGVRLNEDKVKKAVCEAIGKEIKEIGKEQSVILLNGGFEKQDRRLKNIKSEKLRELNKVQCFVRSLYENLVKAVISEVEYKSLKADYEKQASELMAEIERINADICDLNEKRRKNTVMKSSAEKFSENGELTNDLINRFIEEITISHDHRIAIKFFSGREYEKEGV